ncbi:MAG: class I SAM-dependent methyltransferase [Acidobacteriota bacterium]
MGEQRSSGAVLRGIERQAVFNRLRSAFGLRRELPPLLSAADIAPGSRCLEIGAGLGWGTVGLLRKEASLKVVTTDYERAILERARGVVQAAHPHTRVDYVQVDAKALSFASGRFDIVLSLYALHHTGGYQTALAEIARVLRPGGSLLIIDLLRPSFVPQLPASMAPEGILTKPEWQQLFRASGFGAVRWQTRYTLGPLPRCSIVAGRLADVPPGCSTPV